METAYNRWSSYLPYYAAAYGNGASPPKIPRTAAQAIQALSGLIKFFRQQHNEARRAYSKISIQDLEALQLHPEELVLGNIFTGLQLPANL
jgi:hypothetical protein